MHKDAGWKLFFFNLLLVITEVILFSRGLVNLSAHRIPAIVTGVLSAAAFIGVNYWILNAANTDPGFHSERLRDAEDYQNAFEFWMKKSNPFRAEMRTAHHQIEVFRKKNRALRALLGEQARQEGSPFFSVSEDVESCLLTNSKKILNRMTIIDPSEKTKYPMHAEFIRRILSQNQQLLSEYDNLVIEISQIGDTSQVQSLQLEAITQALRELRDENTGYTAKPAEDAGLSASSVNSDLS